MRYACLLLGLFCQSQFAAAAQEAPVLLIKSADGPAYDAFVSGLRRQLQEDSVQVDIDIAHSKDEQQKGGRSRHRLVIALGAEAMRRTDQNSNSLLAAMVPRPAFERFARSRQEQIAQGRISAVYIDQPPMRQMSLIRAALPQARQVGMLFGQATSRYADDYRKAAARVGLKLVARTQITRHGMVGVLDQLLDLVDVLLVMPDPEIHNATTAQHVLLTAFRHRVPVVGYSASYARAGGALSLYSEPERIGRQAARVLIKTMARDWKLSAPVYSDHFSVGQNPRVLRSLGLAVPEPQRLKRDVEMRMSGVAP